MLKQLAKYSIYLIHLDPEATNRCVQVFVWVYASKKKADTK